MLCELLQFWCDKISPAFELFKQQRQAKLIYSADISGGKTVVEHELERLTREERDILLAGCLINYYRNNPVD